MRKIIRYSDIDCYVTKGKYANNGNTAICLYDTEDRQLFAVATVNLDVELFDDEVAIKDYNENTGMLSCLVRNKIVDAPHRHISYGFVKVPICNLLPNLWEGSPETLTEKAI